MKKINNLSMIFFFIAIVFSQYFIEPAYDGFLVLYFLLLIAFFFRKKAQTQPNLSKIGIDVVFLLAYVPVVVYVTIANNHDLRDILRDTGAIGSFFIGKYIISSLYGSKGKNQLLDTISIVGVLISILTVFMAGVAYVSGVSSYEWRASYIPFGHTWLPYILVVNIALLRVLPEERSKYMYRLILCVIGTVSSLSRTDILLDVLIAFSILISHGFKIFATGRSIRMIILLAVVGGTFVPSYMNLDVVQERIGSDADTEDQSLEWRFIENKSMENQFINGGYAVQAFGSGLGTRLKLPTGVYDFDGHNSVPHMHNSFFTIVLKFGVIGLSLFAFFIFNKWRGWMLLSRTSARQYAWIGIWILVLDMGKAVTLQGLTEWSHIMFVGIACMLLDPDSYKQTQDIEAINIV